MLLPASDDSYEVQAKIGRDTYVFHLNVCGETKAGQCKDESGFVSSCQVKDTGDVRKIAGRYQNQTLRWLTVLNF